METIKKAILSDLQQGKRLTVLDAIIQYRSVDLRKYISLLKKDGVNIQSVWVTKNKKSFKEYFITREYKFVSFAYVSRICDGGVSRLKYSTHN